MESEQKVCVFNVGIGDDEEVVTWNNSIVQATKKLDHNKLAELLKRPKRFERTDPRNIQVCQLLYNLSGGPQDLQILVGDFLGFGSD